MTEEKQISDNGQDQKPYIDRVYSALKDNLVGFSKTPDEFKKSMQNKDYASKAYSALKDNLSGFNKTPDEFYQSVGLKKKVSSTDQKIISPKLGSGIPFVQDLSDGSPIPYTPAYEQAHHNAIQLARGTRASVQPKEEKKDRSILESISQGAYLPAFNEGFNELITKPLAGANDFIDRTIDKAYKGITGQETPLWLRKGSGLDNIVKYYDEAYNERDKPSNIISDIAESTVGQLPLVASMFTGEGEASMAMKAPNLFGKSTKILATTGAANAYKDATDKGDDYLKSIEKAMEGGREGAVQGMTMDAQMLLGGALGKGTVNKLVEKGLFKGGKAGEAILHALATGTVFSGTDAAQDLLNGKDIDIHKSMKQFGMGLAMELPLVAKGLNSEIQGKKINDNAARIASVSTSASNLNSESTLRTLINTDNEQLSKIKELPGSHEDLYARSIENGVKAYDSKDINEKRNYYSNQLILKTQGDIKLIEDKIKDPEKLSQLTDAINQSEISDEQKQDLLTKLETLKSTTDETTKIEPSEKEDEIKGQQVAKLPIYATEGTETSQTEEHGKGNVTQGAENAPLQKGEQNAIQEQTTDEGVLRQERPELGLSQVGEGDTEQKITSEKVEEVPEEKDKEVKKTLLTKRAYEGSVSGDVKKYLEEKGLTRKSFSQEERSNQATEFINKFGDDASFNAIKSGDIEGGMATSILAQLQIKNRKAMADLPIDSKERNELAKKQADYIDLAEQKAYLSGESIGQLSYEYQNADLDYANVKNQVENLTKKPLTAKQEENIKNITSENEKLKIQLQESESKLIEETDKAFHAGKEFAANETKTQKAKRIADSLRKNAKLQRPGTFSAATPASLAWDTAIEIVAKSIESGGKIADAIDAGINHIRETDWYKSLSDRKKILAENEFKEFNHNNSGSISLEDLQNRFVDKKDNKFTAPEAKSIWEYMKKTYIENGISYKDAISKTSNDLGLSWRQINEAIITPKLKRTSDEMWKKQSEYARNRNAIKNWISDQSKSTPEKTIQKISGLFRGTAVFGHGGIFVGTHAGFTLFNPSTWKMTIPAFFRGWKFAYGNEANYQIAMEELKNSPNYLIAERAGLKNNPDRINTEEFQKSQKFLGKLGLAGEKGFNAIKVLRQNLFDYHFNKLTASDKEDPSVAKSIAHLINLATGATEIKIPSIISEVSFAGGMEAARWEKLTANPVKATNTALKAILNPDKVSTAERIFAKVWARRVGEQLATFGAMLLANSVIQNQINPNNKINLTDPDKPDFLKFKFGNTTIDPTSGMRSAAMFMYSLGKIPFQTKQELHGTKRIKALGQSLAGYGRGKLSPFYGTLMDFFTSEDYSGNIMPYNDEMPGKGKHHLSWTEYGLSKSPLPIAEAVSTAYKSAIDDGADKDTLNSILKGIAYGAISGSTGFRVGEYKYSGSSKVDKKLSTIKNKEGEEIELTPNQILHRKKAYENAIKNNKAQWKSDFNSKWIKNDKHKELIKKSIPYWKSIGRSKEYIDNKVKEIKQGELDKYIEKRALKISLENLPAATKKNNYSIKN